MIKLKDLLFENFVPDGNRRFWIEPSGKLHDVSELGHSEWGRRYLIEKLHNNTKIVELLNTSYQAPYEILYAAGWIRALKIDNNVFFTYDQIKPNSKIKKTLLVLVKLLEADKLIDSNTNVEL